MVTLGKVKRHAIFSYGSLVGHHDRLVHRRWILKEDIGSPDILDTPELGPVADVQAVCQAIVWSMRTMPLGKLGLVAIALPGALPMLFVAAAQLRLQSILTKAVRTSFMLIRLAITSAAGAIFAGYGRSHRTPQSSVRAYR
ncbi:MULTISPECIES: hypothetical protein [Paraburkholderia]|uniref:Uncharacterized protein n=1 Tax=Paraburkholderia podalyriae TaxID=1938811 RepID=A0ABR7PZV1_9BURK|nr:hypothetical protein [Paraburkholderia podalyriae]MBC8751746.1 hypothetical protein [Paraburkholderia podalyriae]